MLVVGKNHSAVSLNYLATRFTCSWPWSTMVLLCDGRLVCGCADATVNALSALVVFRIGDRLLDCEVTVLKASLDRHGRHGLTADVL